MSEFKPVATAADLRNLDDDEIVAGYRDGLACADEPGSDKSRSYWHGWRNAQTDKGRTPVDINQQRLAHELVGAACRGH
jgi:hypothetical protein